MNENETSSENVNNAINVTEVMTPVEKQKEKNRRGKAKFLICGFLAIIAIAIGLYVGYKKLNNDPMGIYKDTINGIYKTLDNVLKENKDNILGTLDIQKDPFIAEIEAKLESNMPELKNFTGLKYNIATSMDLANKKMNVSINIDESDKALLNLILSVIDENVYLKVFDKVLDLGKEDIFNNMDIDNYLKINGNEMKYDYNNYSYILKEIKNILINSLDKNKFKMENTTITISNKEYKSKKVSYILDKENMERTLKYIKENILKDEKLIKVIAETTGVSTNELTEALKENTNMNGYKDTKIILYTDKFNELIAGSFVVNEDEILKVDCINNEFNLVIEKDNQILKVTQDKKEHITITFNEDNNQVFKIILEQNAKEYKIPFMFNIEGNEVNGTLELKNVEESKDSIAANFRFSLNTTISNEKIDFTLDGKYVLAKANVNSLDTTGSIKINDISEEEAMEILNKFNDLFKRFGLEDLLGSII